MKRDALAAAVSNHGRECRAEHPPIFTAQAEEAPPSPAASSLAGRPLVEEPVPAPGAWLVTWLELASLPVNVKRTESGCPNTTRRCPYRPRVDSAASTLQKADGAAQRTDALARDVVRPDMRRAHSARGKRATGDASLTDIVCESGDIGL